MIGFGKKLLSKGKPIDPEGRRLIGLTLDSDEPIWAPRGHGMVLGSNGAGKSTCAAVPWLLSLASSTSNKAILGLDSKNGELSIQTALLAAVQYLVGGDPRNTERAAKRDVSSFRARSEEWAINQRSNLVHLGWKKSQSVRIR